MLISTHNIYENVFIIAELSANHNGLLETALCTITAMKEAGVGAVRDTEKLLGHVTYDLSPKSLKSREFARSLFVAENVKAGDPITPKNVRSVRPGFGMPPKHLKEILGKRFSQDISKGTPMTWDLINYNKKGT